ncbi:MAG: phosphatidylserine decarboxylase [Verrucomicrobiales bacterium]|nr:phosphatidylserine decarboxylase [Verrucomicrobiales bacterium]
MQHEATRSATDRIVFFNRHSGQEETEAVYGEAFLKWTYQSAVGRLALHALAKRALFSRWYGWRMDQPASRAKVAPFVEKYGLNEAEFALPTADFPTFNAFFSRALQPTARPIDAAPESLVFPADGRHLLIPQLNEPVDFWVKGLRFDVAALLRDEALTRRFAGGSMLISRLCPVDYHRFHFPCAGVPSEARRLDGPLFSVSPLALRARPSILWENVRYLTELDAGDGGRVLYLEIGATCVGAVRQTYRPGVAVAKGEEKGLFLFGGSSVITLFEAGRVDWDNDLRRCSARGMELYARMGERVGRLQGAAS